MTNINKTLGENTATATHRLKMDILYELAKELELVRCPKCSKNIDSARDISVDHIKPWRNVSAELFWDLDNIMFTHKWCNKVDRPRRRECPEGTRWCHKCQDFLDEALFGKSKLCLKCDATRVAAYDARNRRHPCPACGAQMRKKCKCGYDMPMKDYMSLRRKEGARY